MPGPIKTIRLECVACMGGQYSLIEDCPSLKCPLRPYRRGRKPVVRPELAPLKAIRAQCLECVGGSPADVRACSGRLLAGGVCPVHRFRFGANPKRKGIGNLQGNVQSFPWHRSQDATLAQEPDETPKKGETTPRKPKWRQKTQ